MTESSNSKTDKGKSKAKNQNQIKEYRVDPKSLKKYSNLNQNIINRDSNSWKKATNNNRKLTSHLSHLSSTYLNTISKSSEHDDLLLSKEKNGTIIEVENELEKTYKVSQDQIKSVSGSEVKSKSFSLGLEGGPYNFDYTRNGRFLALSGRQMGKLATIDWKSSKAYVDLSVNETTRAIRWLHNESFFAVAQRRYVYIYDGKQGMEVHQLRGHIEVNQMEFLPYHFLLATIGMPGWLKYHDTSTGSMIVEHRTKLGSCQTMSQNPHNAIINLGHQNGTVTLWSPSFNQPHVKFLAHRGPVSSVSVDPSSSGRIISTTGLDGTLKVWDTRTWKSISSWTLKKPGRTSAWSQKGLLAIGWGSHVSIYDGVGRQDNQKGAYMTQLFPSQQVQQVQFCPFEDILGVGHTSGFSNLIIPGSGEANFDSLELDPYENQSHRREREIRNLLDKIPSDLINLNPDFVGTIAEPVLKESEELKKLKGIKKSIPYRKLDRIEKLTVQGKLIEDEALDDDNGNDDSKELRKKEVQNTEKKKMRGKNSSLKRLLRKKRKNIITPETEALKLKMAIRKQRLSNMKEKPDNIKPQGALGRFSSK